MSYPEKLFFLKNNLPTESMSVQDRNRVLDDAEANEKYYFLDFVLDGSDHGVYSMREIGTGRKTPAGEVISEINATVFCADYFAIIINLSSTQMSMTIDIFESDSGLKVNAYYNFPDGQGLTFSAVAQNQVFILNSDDEQSINNEELLRVQSLFDYTLSTALELVTLPVTNQ